MFDCLYRGLLLAAIPALLLHSESQAQTASPHEYTSGVRIFSVFSDGSLDEDTASGPLDFGKWLPSTDRLPFGGEDQEEAWFGEMSPLPERHAILQYVLFGPPPDTAEKTAMLYSDSVIPGLGGLVTKSMATSALSEQDSSTTLVANYLADPDESPHVAEAVPAPRVAGFLGGAFCVFLIRRSRRSASN